LRHYPPVHGSGRKSQHLSETIFTDAEALDETAGRAGTCALKFLSINLGIKEASSDHELNVEEILDNEVVGEVSGKRASVAKHLIRESVGGEWFVWWRLKLALTG
jgi:hypothetical protein